jgi:hypothetical protein
MRTISFPFTCKQCGWLNTPRDAQVVALPGGVDLVICDYCGAVWAVRVLKWNLTRKGVTAGQAKG